MAPPAKTLERDLKKAVRELFDTDELTVNAVRKRVEEMHNLDEDFFSAPEWKNRSKTIIKDFLGKLEEGNASEEEGEPENQPEAADSSPIVPPPKPKRANGVKRSSPSAKPPAAKRQKKAAPAKPTKKAAPAKTANKRKLAKKAGTESELSEEEDEEQDDTASESEAELSEEEAPKPRGKAVKKADKDDSESDLSELDSSEGEKPKRKTSAKPKSKPAPAKSESELSKPGVDEGDDSKNKDEPPAKPKADGEQGSAKTGDIIDSDSELSSVIDDPPPRKRGKGAASKGPSKPSATKAPPKQVSADEEEIKKLQGHLVKCGVRKIWGIELKTFRDDTKAKIRHLRGMLTDAGMTGRFSEARAKEIKEQRELMADLEAVQDMNALWGSAKGGGRASRSRASKKSVREAPDDEEEEEDNDDDDQNSGNDDGNDEAKANSRVSKRMADLAFLGDESESD
ncbi:hypothetical protein MN608_09156 [Microdochium nivale]|nr:hypothetical protein MN608_09156 [Microdochium nivale]